MYFLLFKTALLALLLMLANTPSIVIAESRDNPDKPPGRNVVLIIGDGMDDHQITIARNYLKGVRALTRDLNEDLWNAPFDTEFESVVLEVKNLFVPILEAVGKYGSKKRHLNKFQKPVEQFYKKNIVDRDYKGETSIKYQKRFQRYKQSLFTFLEKDSIPWNNNMAERAIRHLAVQRKISGYFFESSAHQYLVLLGIGQTCRFQGKSFLKFLMSGEKDVDKFKASRRIKTSAPVGRQAARESDKLVNVHEET